MLRFQNGMEEGVNGSELISQPCLPNSSESNEMRLLRDDRPDSPDLSKPNANDNQDYIEIRPCYVDQRLNWTMLEQGFSPSH